MSQFFFNCEDVEELPKVLTKDYFNHCYVSSKSDDHFKVLGLISEIILYFKLLEINRVSLLFIVK